jgi:uncharacterized protein (DUF1015 family)
MPIVRPFRGVRPREEHAAQVIAPPYDVVSTEEARTTAGGRPNNFLHVSRPEIDLLPGTSFNDDQTYTKAAENYRALLRREVLAADPREAYYVYRIRLGEHIQTGVVASVAVADYVSQRVRRHELTRPDKEDDRARHIETLGAQTGPALLTFRDNAALHALIEAAAKATPEYEDLPLSGARHTLWRVDEPAQVAEFTHAFALLPCAYIADGHHRTAAAARVAQNRGGAAGDPWQYFLAVLFPASEMHILPYHRVVRDLHGQSAEDLLTALRHACSVEPVALAYAPSHPRECGMYLKGIWYRLELPASGSEDPRDHLDVSLLERHVLRPLLGIENARTDARIDFVGGARGVAELERRVNEAQAAVAFAMYPTALSDLMDIADAGGVMPPKSTWFEPKLADGLVCYDFNVEKTDTSQRMQDTSKN